MVRVLPAEQFIINTIKAKTALAGGLSFGAQPRCAKSLTSCSAERGTSVGAAAITDDDEGFLKTTELKLSTQ